MCGERLQEEPEPTSKLALQRGGRGTHHQGGGKGAVVDGCDIEDE